MTVSYGLAAWNTSTRFAMSNFTFLQELLNTVADQSRSFLPRSFFPEDHETGLQELAQALMSGRGEASGVAIAHQLARRYELAEADLKLKFFCYLTEKLKPEADNVRYAAVKYLADPSTEHLTLLQQSVASPLEEFFRRVNIAPGGTAKIVRMREDLINFMHTHTDLNDLKIIDSDLEHLLQSWFNRGFLVLRRIDWHTPATILDKIIAYEAVHKIGGWDDLRRRLDPADRRCFAFFYPSLIDELLIFVQVALMNETPTDIARVLAMAPPARQENEAPTTAVFYSISNCQNGLRGISFGNFLIKQVVEELSRESPSLDTFVTLSPVPGFARWLEALANKGDQYQDILDENSMAAVNAIRSGNWLDDKSEREKLEPSIQALAAVYFLNEKNKARSAHRPSCEVSFGEWRAIAAH